MRGGHLFKLRWAVNRINMVTACLSRALLLLELYSTQQSQVLNTYIPLCNLCSWHKVRSARKIGKCTDELLFAAYMHDCSRIT